MIIPEKTEILFIGDSITDCGRERPVGARAGLGNGYVALVNSLIESVYPEKKIRILNTGIGGNTVVDLAGRWETDCLALNPDWLVIKIGINDVWRQFGNPVAIDQVDHDRFRRIYSDLIDKTLPTVKQMILMSPYFLEVNKNDPMRKMMDEYGQIVKALAEDNDILFVDTQAGFDKYLVSSPSQSLCGDRVHPNLTGHMIIARTLLDVIEFDWSL